MYEGAHFKEIRFIFGGSPVRAWADPVDSVHDNVLRLTLVRPAWQERVATVVNTLLPHFVRRFFHFLAPQSLLPSRVILKTRKPDWDAEFDNEKAIYNRLKPLQGRILPTLLGDDAIYNDSPAIVLSYIDGLPSYKQGPTPMPLDEFERQVEALLWQFTKFGVAYGDTKLDNFLILAGRVMVVDLEAVSEEDEADYELAVTSHCEHVTQQYRTHVKNLSDPD